MPAPKGSLGKYTPAKPSPTMYAILVATFIVYSIAAGYVAGLQPGNEWRFFSWHPLFMTVGMVGLAGTGAVTKKLGGYANTKIHAILGWASILCSTGGLWVIYTNKNMKASPHLTSTHGKMGAGVMLSIVGLGLAGTVFLHPDFGIDKTNKTIRLAHKTGARLTLLVAWTTAFLGLQQMASQQTALLGMFALPLIVLVPFSLM